MIPRVCALLACAGIASCTATFRGEPEASLDPSRDIAGTVIEVTLGTERIRRIAERGATEAERNEIIHARLAELDILYYEYERQISRELRDANFVAALVGIGVGGAGALAGETASQILSAISGAVSGAQEAFDSEVLVDRTIQAFAAQMQAQRATIRSAILLKLSANTASYPLQAALSDLAAYRQAGTLTAALVGISEDATERAAEAEAALEVTEIFVLDRRRFAPTAASRGMLDWINDPGIGADARDERRRQARTCFDSSGATDKPQIFPLFLTDAARFPELERDLVECLNSRFQAGVSQGG